MICLNVVGRSECSNQALWRRRHDLPQHSCPVGCLAPVSRAHAPGDPSGPSPGLPSRRRGAHGAACGTPGAGLSGLAVRIHDAGRGHPAGPGAAGRPAVRGGLPGRRAALVRSCGRRVRGAALAGASCPLQRFVRAQPGRTGRSCASARPGTARAVHPAQRTPDPDRPVRRAVRNVRHACDGRLGRQPRGGTRGVGRVAAAAPRQTDRRRALERARRARRRHPAPTCPRTCWSWARTATPG